MNNKAFVASRNGPADHVDLVDKLQKSLKCANKVRTIKGTFATSAFLKLLYLYYFQCK
jgi:hypothetical protein